MRYSRFRQQMEGSTTTTVPKTTKPKKANSKTDMSKTAKQFSKGKNPYEKSKGFDDGKYGSGNYGSESSLKKRPAPDDFMKQDNKIGGGGYGVMGTEQMNSFAPVMYDPFASAASYWTPSTGTILSTDNSTFPYMMPMPDLQQQQQHFPVDPFANMYLGPNQQMQNGEDMSMSLNQGWGPQSYGQMFPNDHFNQNHANPAAARLTATATAAPKVITAPTNTPELNNQLDFCFSGCCQQPPPYPGTPSLYPDVPTTQDHPGDSLLSATVEPWVPPPPQNQWVAIKPEPGEDGNVDDIFVKVESDA